MALRRGVRESVIKGSDEIRQSLDSIVLSDEYHEVQCSPCEKDGKSIAAEMYCVDCDQYFCPTCLRQHDKFDSMKNHQLVENIFKTGDDTRQGSCLDLPSQRCETHHGRLLDVYCQDHNQVCCGTCVSIHHSSCVGLSYIPDTAKVTDAFKEGSEMLEELGNLQTQSESLVEERQVQVEKLKGQKARISDEVKDMCSKIIDHFKTLETHFLTKLDSKVNDLEDVLQREINNTGEVSSTLKHEQNLLVKHLSADNAASVFVQRKLAEKSHLACADILKQVQPSSTKCLEFSVNHKAKDILNEIQSIGDIIENKTIASFSQHGDYDVNTTTDKSICDITDIILHKDGTLFLTDFENNCIKRVNSQYRVVESRSLLGKPYSLCFVDSANAAVTLTDISTVQFVNIQENMVTSSSFKVGDHCRGIAHKDGYIYVTCGGHYKYGEGHGRIEVYTCSGKHLKTYDTDMSPPKHILKHKYGHLMYITDCHNRLVLMTTDGRILKRLIFRDIDKAVGICSGPGIQYFLCGLISNTIGLLSGNDSQLHTLRVDGVRRPQALCFDHIHSRLFVAMDTTNTIKAIDLSFE